MLVLAVDTSTPLVTAGVVMVSLPHELVEAGPTVEPVSVLAQHVFLDAFAHTERLMPLVTAALAERSLTLADLDAVVVGLGPGPFTGLRVGIATAAALGDALDIPVHGVPSHDAVARAIAPAPAAFLVVTDARRREVYVTGFDAQARRQSGSQVLAPSALTEFVGGLSAAPQAIAGAGASLAGLPLPVLPQPLLSLGLARAAAASIVTGAVPGPLTPLYLRRPDATEPMAVKSVLTR